MLNVAHQIIRAQEALKNVYDEDDYKNTISLITEKAHGDTEMLYTISKDKSLGSTVRLFAIAAMGE